jgi:predicted ATP-dependent endonuclease of OLD family
MNLKEIQIKNFRSIKEETISFNQNCLILIGKNEAGKTNLLKAIASVFGEYQVSNKDKRKRIDNEKITEYYIRAVYNLDSNDIDLVEKKFKSKYTDHEAIQFKNEITLKQYISKVFYNINNKIIIADGQKPSLVYWNSSNIKGIELETPLFITSNIISYVGTVKFDLESAVFEIVKELYLENNYKCFYWQYSDDYLLPNSVDIDSFISSPAEYKSLLNIFSLCGRENIQKEFDSSIAEDGDYSNLLDQVSRKITATFQKIWKDFKGTSIQLLPDGSDILIKVVDKAKYNFEDRSDGFKKFISILLMLSTESRSNKISKSDIILIDEPDQSLYPTSAQYLRDELLDIGRKTKIIYSTHSQYMIDADCLDRHIIVEKFNDVTTLRKEEKNAPFVTDELLKRAIGSSVFEVLKEKNIIFEGYLDKLLFNKFCKFNKIEKEFDNYGIVYLSGISGVETLVQILALASKKFLIIADSDETSNNKRNDFSKNYPEFKSSWLAYADVCKKVCTMEDFYTQSYLEEQFKVLLPEVKYDSRKSVIYNIENAVNKDKEQKQRIKNVLIESTSKDDIVPDYSKFVDKIKSKFEENLM